MVACVKLLYDANNINCNFHAHASYYIITHFPAAMNVVVRATLFHDVRDIFTDVNIATNEHNVLLERFVLLIKGLVKNKIYGKVSSVTVMKKIKININHFSYWFPFILMFSI